MAGAASAAHAEAGTTAGAALVRARLIDVRARVLLRTAGGVSLSPCHNSTFQCCHVNCL